ncbi:MAG: uracil-DNA glycosylase family protein [Candidatus Nanoarchaeia archaeon]|jgi:uracil-DNA glycosylase|nr:uracil-DNA glycosylase family protein [Candidatus Nanoarchaeia archaeon]
MICRKTENRLDEINFRIQACTNCELCNLEYNKKDISKGYGKLYGWRGGHKKCRFMLIGMNPSYNRFSNHEYAFGGVNGSPGPGEKFISLLKEISIFKEVFIDNVCHCSSEDNTIKLVWAQSCFKYIIDEIEVLRPVKIITMGSKVFDFFKILSSANNIKIPIENIWHPSYVFSYRRATKNEYKEMLLKIINI